MFGDAEQREQRVAPVDASGASIASGAGYSGAAVGLRGREVVERAVVDERLDRHVADDLVADAARACAACR